MKQEGGLDLMCTIHSEKIVSVKLSDKGEAQMFCYKCLTLEQMSIEQLSQQLTEFRSKKIQKLIELQKQGKKRFLSLKKVFQNIKEMFNQQIEDIIKNTDNLMNETIQTLKKQTEIFNQPESQPSINLVVQYIKEEVTIDDKQQNYKQWKVKMIKQYIQLAKSLNKQIKGELVQVKEIENQIIKNDQKQEKEGKQIQRLVQVKEIEKQIINNISNKRLGSNEQINQYYYTNKVKKALFHLKKLFLNIQDMFNQQIQDIINNTDNLMNETTSTLKMQTEILNQPISQLSIIQVVQYIKEAKEEVPINNQQQNYNQLKVKMIKQYIQLVKSLNKQIKGELLQVKEVENQIMKNYQKQEKQGNLIEIYSENNLKQSPPPQFFIIQKNQQFCSNILQNENQFFFLNQQTVESCCSIVFDYTEQILLSAQNKNIILWDINTQGSLNKKYALEGHNKSVMGLCFGNKGFWFLSAGDDYTIRIWSEQVQGQWKCIQIIENESKANQILITNDDEQFISCHYYEDKIRIWMKNKKKQLWECYQKLDEHTFSVKFITLSQNGQYLVSSQDGGKMILWSKGNDQLWQCKQLLSDDYHRLSFISNNELIITCQHKGRFRRYCINDKGKLKLKQTLDFDKQKDENSQGFPMIFNQQLKLAIFRHFAYTYIMKQQENGDFLIHQKIKGNHTAGCIKMNGQFLILCEKQEKLQVWNIEQHRMIYSLM